MPRGGGAVHSAELFEEGGNHSALPRVNKNVTTVQRTATTHLSGRPYGRPARHHPQPVRDGFVVPLERTRLEDV